VNSLHIPVPYKHSNDRLTFKMPFTSSQRAAPSVPSTLERAMSSSSDENDAVEFVDFVRRHVRNTSSTTSSPYGKVKPTTPSDGQQRQRLREDYSDDDDRVTPSKRAESMLNDARMSARASRLMRETTRAEVQAESARKRRSASAAKLSASTTPTTSRATSRIGSEADLARVFESSAVVVVSDESEDEFFAKTPVRVGRGGGGGAQSFRTTHMETVQQQRQSTKKETVTNGRRASMTPPMVPRMSISKSPAPRPVHSLMTTATTTATQDESLTRVRGMNISAVEAQVELLRAKVATLQRELDDASIEKQSWLSERVRMSAEVTSVEEELKTTTSRMSKMERRLMALMKERDAALGEAESTRVALEKARAEHASALDRESSSTRDKVVSLEFNVREYSVKIERLQTVLQETQTKIRADEATILKLEERLASATADLQAANAKLGQATDGKLRLESESAQLKTSVDELNASLRESNEKYERVSSELATANSKTESRERQLQEVNAANEKLKADINRLNETISLNNNTLFQKDAAIETMRSDAEKELDEARHEISTLEAEIKAKTNIAESAKQAKDEVISELEEVKAALRSKTSESRAFEIELESMKGEIAALEMKLEKESRKAMTTEEKAENAKDAFAARLAAAQEKQATFQGRLHDMKTSLEAEKQKLEAQARADVHNLEEELAVIKQRLAEKELAYTTASNNAVMFEQRLEATIAQLEEAKDAVRELRGQLAESDITGVELKHMSEELDAANKRVQVVEGEKKQAVDELRKVKKDFQSLQGKIAGLEAAADLAASESEDLRRKLDMAEQDALATAEENELASSMAAKATMVANAQVVKLEKQVVVLKSELESLREKHAEDSQASREDSDDKLDRLHQQVEASGKRIKELSELLDKERSSNAELNKRSKNDASSRIELETQLTCTKEQLAAAEARLFETNNELLSVHKQLDSVKKSAQEHRKSDGGELISLRLARDTAESRSSELQASVTKVTAERDLLQESISSMEKRLEHERLAFAAQVKDAVKDAVRAKEQEMSVIRKELDTIRQLAVKGDNASAALTKTIDDKQAELDQARTDVSELRAEVMTLTHQVEHANELLATARRDASTTQAGDQDELKRVRMERDEAKSLAQDLELKLSEAKAQNSWLEGTVSATEAELNAVKRAAASATKMNEDAVAQLSRNSASMKKRNGNGFGSPALQGELSPLKWFSRQASRVISTPPNNLFNKFAVATPTVPMRTPGGTWRAPSKPETVGEAMQTLAAFGAAIAAVIMFMSLVAMIAPKPVDSPLASLPSVDCGVFYTIHDGMLEIGYSLIGRTYRSLCVHHPPS
jgi:chromosome segregation ATPase